ncbi:MAG: COG1615 family transporter, partial [Clostridia bacterium]|nr:COG1615 family transporter [Clostridia bacterium]
YRFNDIDIDRYHINGKLRQVMLSARELDQNKLPDRSQNWINQRMHYTHGYGLAMNLANSFTPSGQPEFIAGDLPFRSSVAIEINEPRIYFGEITGDYVLIGTKRNEFDYSTTGEEDFVETRYRGDGGVAINSLWHRLIFAFRFNDYRLLVSNELTPQSKILYNRNINTRVNKIMPYLYYDDDPYLVIADGRLYWILEAYTLTGMYPYAEPVSNGVNYIRNSVKVVIDAYNGSVDYYIVDKDDPLLQTLASIFPGLFKPLESMPAEVQKHLRYPPKLLNIQASMLGNYHMDNPALFYNKEDAWHIAEEIVGDKRQTMEPYFTVMRLPGAEYEEFVLMLPYTPARKVNMIAWLAARNDSPHYGQLILYRFPKERTIYGPMQIESRIDQDARISQQLTLWDQRGSQVIRGNLLVLPVKESLLYVEPIFLQAQESRLPELRQVIVAYGDSIVMADNLESALQSIFGDLEKDTVPEESLSTPLTSDQPDTEAELVLEANRLYQQALDSLKSGDWATYGQYIDSLGQILTELKQIYNE